MNSVPCKHCQKFLSVLAIVSVLILAGCKTDPLAGEPKRVEDEAAPVGDLENPVGVELPSIPVANRTEVDLVEELIMHRAMYARCLRALVTYYTDRGYINKANWAQNELNDLRQVKPYRYIEDAQVPQTDLRPTESILEADKLYEEGLQLMEKGGHGVPVFYNQKTMKLALSKFKQLINEYPNSDKIDDAAFMIGEIHKEYFENQDDEIALKWYQRALDWNPNLPYPARFQMAVIYDYRLHERENALEMYQRVVENERFNKSNLEFAKTRIEQLSSEETRQSPAEAPEEPGPAALPQEWVNISQ
jgi:tetratricopeptide (TPR) repeat protein